MDLIFSRGSVWGYSRTRGLLLYVLVSDVVWYSFSKEQLLASKKKKKKEIEGTFAFENLSSVYISFIKSDFDETQIVKISC